MGTNFVVQNTYLHYYYATRWTCYIRKCQWPNHRWARKIFHEGGHKKFRLLHTESIYLIRFDTNFKGGSINSSVLLPNFGRFSGGGVINFFFMTGVPPPMSTYEGLSIRQRRKLRTYAKSAQERQMKFGRHRRLTRQERSGNSRCLH